MTSFQLTAGPWAVLILAVGIAAFLGAMAAAAWAGRHRDDLDPATEARIWARVRAAIEEDER